MASRRRALALAALLAGAACAVAEPPRESADSGAVAAGEATGDGAHAPRDSALADTAPARPASTGSGTPDTIPSPAAPAPAAGAAPPEPTAAELEALAATLVVPVAGVERGELRDSFADARGERRHDALDIPAPRGTPVLSAAAGRVVKLFTSEAGGLMVYASDPSERFVLLYGHLDAYDPALREGMPLAPGQRLGVVGTTGNAPPGVPHLHFGITRVATVREWWRGRPVNPYPLLVRGHP